jgi:hypothetical protein
MSTKKFQMGLAIVLGLVMGGAMTADTVVAAVAPITNRPVPSLIKPGYLPPGYRPIISMDKREQLRQSIAR